MVLDLDNFKYVNDSMGHAVGDELICSTAAAIESRLRETDTAARLGGDEFAVILPRASVEGAEHVARSLLDVIRQKAAVQTPDGPRRTTASAGIALMDRGLTGPEVLAHADMAMYEAKERGKDGVVVFDPGADRQAQAEAGCRGPSASVPRWSTTASSSRPSPSRHWPTAPTRAATSCWCACAPRPASPSRPACSCRWPSGST